MQPKKARYVTACQQLLALGLVCAALTPAANIISLDVVPHAPSNEAVGAQGAGQAPASMAAYVRASQLSATVPTAPVDAKVKEYALTAPSNARVAPGLLTARRVPGKAGSQKIVSQPAPVVGYGAVGVTWEQGQSLADSKIKVKVRYQQQGGWSKWTKIAQDDDHGPDAGSAEAAGTRPGTDAMLVGDVDQVQVKINTKRIVPSDLRLSVISPGEATSTKRERPALDTGEDTDVPAPPPVDDEEPAYPSTEEDPSIALQAAAYTPRPKIFSRAQWGADERLRDTSSLHYGEVHAGFVHHTVNANEYTAAQVPGILRSIYAYHTRSRGWSDVGYNYLVDRFGRIWEGRAGGIDRAVVGAHTLGYNDDAFAASAIGNFETARPSAAMVEAYGALFAWKLSLHGVSASSTKQFVTSKSFQAINGHRDAGSTACPGKYLYAQIPKIRQLAAAAQRGWAGRQLETNYAGAPGPDLIVRRTSDKLGFILPIVPRSGGGYTLGKAIATGVNLAAVKRIMRAGDWDRDGFADMIGLGNNGSLYLYRGNGTGKFSAPTLLAPGWAQVKLAAAVGDMTGDGYPDLMGQPAGSAMRIYPGRGTAGVGASYVAYAGIRAGRQIPIGLMNADGAPDSLFRVGNKLNIYSGNGPGGFTGAQATTLNLAPYNWSVGISDAGITGHADLVVRSKGSGQLWLLQGTATGFVSPILLSTATAGFDLVG